MLRVLAALFCALLLAAPASATDDFVASGEPGDTISVSVVTFEPGSEYWQRFGHNALLLRESTRDVAITYNYGLFDFQQKNFFLNFARGEMVYRVAPNYLANDLAIYNEEQRWAVEQKLNLTPAQRGWLRDYLSWNVQRENRDYRYDYFLSNCSTKVRDALDRALGGSLRTQLESRDSGFDFRREALRLIAPAPLLMVGMDAALGPAADRPISVWQHGFAPLRLMAALRTVTTRDAEGHEQPLVAEESQLLPGGVLPEPPALPPDLRLPFAMIGIALALALLLLARYRGQPAARYAFAVLATLLSLVVGLGGLILAALWALTAHRYGWRNENLLLLSPLCLLLIPVWLGTAHARWQPSRYGRTLALLIVIGVALAAFLHAFPALSQANGHWWLLLAPIHVALALSLRKPATP